MSKRSPPRTAAANAASRPARVHGSWTLMLMIAQLGHLPILGLLYTEMQDWLRAMLLRDPQTATIGQNNHDRDDAINETFLKVLENLHRFNPILGQASTWVWTICRNQALTVLRQRGRHPTVSLEVVGDPATVLTGPDRDPAAGMIDAEHHEQVRSELKRALQKLKVVLEDEPEDVGRAFRMRLDGLSYKETAEVLGVPIGTVATWIHRCRGKLD